MFCPEMKTEQNYFFRTILKWQCSLTASISIRKINLLKNISSNHKIKNGQYCRIIIIHGGQWWWNILVFAYSFVGNILYYNVRWFITLLYVCGEVNLWHDVASVVFETQGWNFKLMYNFLVNSNCQMLILCFDLKASRYIVFALTVIVLYYPHAHT